MAEISTAITYAVKFTEKEYELVVKGLALIAGIKGPRADDVPMAGNVRHLKSGG